MPKTAICPHLRLKSDPTLVRTEFHGLHRCFAQHPPGAPDEAHQRTFCLSPSHETCEFYRPEWEAEEIAAPGRLRPFWLRFLSWAIPAALLVAVILVYGRDSFGPVGSLNADAPAPGTVLNATASPVTTPPAPSPPAPDQAASLPSAGPARLSTEQATPIPEPDGSVLSLAPGSGDAGWFSSGEARGNHLGDSFLYAGYFQQDVFVSAIFFDLGRVRRGAPIREATLRLAGLNAERFQPAAGGAWSVSLLPAGALPDYRRASFQEIFNARAAVTLLPTLAAADLAAPGANVWTLDAASRDWLAGQVLEGAPGVILRIMGPAGGPDTLFAWDSGVGPATRGAEPQLVLGLGPPPSTPPPLPTEFWIIATETATPANVLTAAANSLAATALASEFGTPTPAPYRFVTATPLAANLATVQAAAAQRGLPPVVAHTPPPANAATATMDAAYATAIAITIGTYTPVPENAVTPLVILPTPMPENVVTAAAQLLEARARVGQETPGTPLPYNAVVATLTPRPPVIGHTATPENYATTLARSAYATAIAIIIGTYTPMPPDAVTVTPAPRPTDLPLVLYLDTLPPTTIPTSTPVVPATMPRELVGQVLFISDRAGEPRLFALDPGTGRLAYVTQPWPYQLAKSREVLAGDGFRSLVVQEDSNRLPQVYVRDSRYNSLDMISPGTGWSYDPAWSPLEDRIVMVSQEPGNDEIYTVYADGAGLQRLTSNNWEWDKHPTWSPDGAQILFWSNREVGWRQLWIMDADGQNQRRFYQSPYNDWDPVWVK